MSKSADDDFLAIDDDDKRLPMHSPEAVAKRAATHSKNLKVPEKVELPENEDGDPASAMKYWPYYLPIRGDRGGRPRIIETAEEFDRLVDEYFVEIWERSQRPTMTGLQLHLGFASSQSFNDYLNREEFSGSVMRARNLVKAAYETNLIRHQGSVQGVMFALKNFGRVEGDWIDVNKTELTGENGQPIQTMNANINLNTMSPIEKAARLFQMMRIATMNQTVEREEDEEDEDDDMLDI